MKQDYQAVQKAKTTELVHNEQNKDMKSFNELYDLHVDLLYNYGSKLTTDTELLKDCIQDIFVKMYHKLDELQQIQNVKSYLLISLKNKLCDESRRRVHVSDLDVTELHLTSGKSVEHDYITEEVSSHSKNRIAKLLNNLSPRQRVAIELYYIQEKDYDDICEILELNYQSARNLIHRGVAKLRNIAVQFQN